MSYLSNKRPTPNRDSDAELLAVLHEIFLDDQFDEIHVGIYAIDHPRLLAALAFLNPKIDRRRRALTHRTVEDVAAWLDRVENRPAGGLVLEKDRRGWSHVMGCTGGGPP
jgi:hypothetical protein